MALKIGGVPIDPARKVVTLADADVGDVYERLSATNDSVLTNSVGKPYLMFKNHNNQVVHISPNGDIYTGHKFGDQSSYRVGKLVHKGFKLEF